MRVIRKIIYILIVIVIVVILAGVIYLRYISRRALPDYNQDIQLSGLLEDVYVYRDQYAVPHIYAGNENDLYMVTGYLLAQDRMWQMDLLRRITLGRLSEIFGEDFIETDLLLRGLRFSEKSEKILAVTDKKQLAAINAFCEGINQYIKSNYKKLPVEFTLLGYKPEPWEPLHTVNLIGYMAWDLKAGWNELVLEDIREAVDGALYSELIPDYTGYTSVVYPENDKDCLVSDIIKGFTHMDAQLEGLGAGVFDASNNWAIDGSKSLSGKPVLANDMHLGLNIPGIWYQAHQVIDGELNVTGLLLPGAPFIVCGHNENIAWGMTNVMVDNLDFYLDSINPLYSGKYLFNGQWLDIDAVKQTITTREGNEYEKDIRFTCHGLIVSDFLGISDRTISMHCVCDESSNELKTIYLLNRASNWTEFKDALPDFKSTSQNIVYADISGNIGMYCAAGIPIRKRDSIYPLLPGYTDEYDWIGMVPFKELPCRLNPDSGFAASANNRTVGDDYRYHIGTWYALPYRIDRINHTLSDKDSITVEDMKELQLNQKSGLAEKYMPLLLAALKDEELQTELEKQGYALLEKWDCVYDRESAAATIFETYYEKLFKNIFSDELGNDLFSSLMQAVKITRIKVDKIMETRCSAWIDNVNTVDHDESINEIIAASYKEAVAYLQAKYGDNIDLWKWGDVHRFTLEHPLAKKKILDRIFRLNRGPFRTGGSFHTVSPFSFPVGEPEKVYHGSSHRHIYMLDNWDNSLTVIPTGNCGIPSSKHYCDQTDLYISGKYHADYFSEELVKKNAKYKMTFKRDSAHISGTAISH
jgi:penicillin amidase